MAITVPWRAPGATRERPAGSRTYDWIVVTLSGLLIVGVYVDGWAHHHFAALETFFSPWHAVMYGAYALMGGFTGATLLVNWRRGHAWGTALPAGYALTLLGSLVFAVGGVGDMLWHMAFGTEQGFDAFLSPTHLLLVLGAGLMVSGPLRAAWARPATARLVDLLPALLSLTFMLTVLSFITAYAHPFVNAWPAQARPGGSEMVGVLSILLQTALLMGPVLLVVGRWRLPLGALGLVFSLNAVFMSVLADQFWVIPVALLTGGLADALLHWLQPSPARPAALRLFAFVTPVVLYGLYFLALARLGGIGWTVHVWTGAIVVAGIAGWLLSYLLVPPAQPAPDHAADATRDAARRPA